MQNSSAVAWSSSPSTGTRLRNTLHWHSDMDSLTAVYRLGLSVTHDAGLGLRNPVLTYRTAVFSTTYGITPLVGAAALPVRHRGRSRVWIVAALGFLISYANPRCANPSMATGGGCIVWPRVRVAQAFKLLLTRHDRYLAPRVGSFGRGCSG